MTYRSAKPEPRIELSRDRILDAAMSLMDREGDGTFTFRRLGAELRVDPTAAYRHFRNKDELLLALGDRVLGEAIAASGHGRADADWRTTLHRAAHAIRDTLTKHPKLAAVISVRITQGEHEAAAIELGLGALAKTGLPTREVVAIQRAFADTILAWSAFSASYMGLSAVEQARDRAAWATTYAQLPAERYPHIHAAREYLDEFDDAFDIALELLFDGIQARIDAQPSKPSETPSPSQETE